MIAHHSWTTSITRADNWCHARGAARCGTVANKSSSHRGMKTCVRFAVPKEGLLKGSISADVATSCALMADDRRCLNVIAGDRLCWFLRNDDDRATFFSKRSTIRDNRSCVREPSDTILLAYWSGVRLYLFLVEGYRSPIRYNNGKIHKKSSGASCFEIHGDGARM
jgi:hypothetical protein